MSESTNAPCLLNPSGKGTVFVRRGRVYVGGYPYKPRHCIVKEKLVALAKITFLTKVLPVKWSSVFHTASATDIEVSTDKTFAAQVCFRTGEFSFYAACSQLFYRRFKNVAQSPLRLDKEITTKSIAGMFNNDILTALSVERAYRVPARNVIRQERIKIANAQFPRPLFVPAVEYPAQEFAILLRRD